MDDPNRGVQEHGERAQAVVDAVSASRAGGDAERTVGGRRVVAHHRALARAITRGRGGPGREHRPRRVSHRRRATLGGARSSRSGRRVRVGDDGVAEENRRRFLRGHREARRVGARRAHGVARAVRRGGEGGGGRSRTHGRGGQRARRTRGRSERSERRRSVGDVAPRVGRRNRNRRGGRSANPNANPRPRGGYGF